MNNALSLELLDNRYPTLHGLRVLAIVSVVQLHVSYVFAQDREVRLDPGFTASSMTVFFGMDLFFILSGFLIGSILLRALAKDGRQQLGRFYIRRATRTFPSYYVVLTFLALTMPLNAMQARNLWVEYVYGTNFVSLHPGDAVMSWGWSLALEEQFYLVVPLLFFILHRLRSDSARMTLLVMLWLSALVIRLVLFVRWAPWTDQQLYSTLYFRPYTRFDTLAAGIVLAFVHHRWGGEITQWLKTPFHRAILGLTSLACLWLLLEPGMFGAGGVQLVRVFAWGTVTSIMYFGWLLLLIHGDPGGLIHRALSLRPFRSIATLGYGVYLVHIPLLDGLIVPLARKLQAYKLPMPMIWTGGLVALMIASLALAYVLHVVIEKPSLRLRDRLAG